MEELKSDSSNLPDEAETQPWQMTKAQYEAKYGKPRGNSTVTGRFSKHKSAVEIALNRGFRVPDEVLNDYPDLKGN
ncbi:MAG: hypothetical protein EOP06_05675 [Proteobacteria bacterium]|nr:MAG: hypothetical protein EOP06_05675 [Pseudomonadota bacterium]